LKISNLRSLVKMISKKGPGIEGVWSGIGPKGMVAGCVGARTIGEVLPGAR
jgi:hypothetical protein